MKHLDISSVFKSIGKTVSKNKSQICIATGIALSISSTAWAIWGTLKAKKKVDAEEADTKTEIVKAVWFYYIPAVVTEVFGIGFFIGANMLNEKENAALVAAYSLTSTAFKEYKDKVSETFGEKKEESIRDSIIKDKVENSPLSSSEVYIASSGDTLFYDVLSDRYFTSNVNTIRKAINKINRDMLSENYMSLNELYYELGLNGVKVGEDLGWRIEDGYIDIRFSGQVTEDEKPCLALEFNIAPQYGFQQLY